MLTRLPDFLLDTLWHECFAYSQINAPDIEIGGADNPYLRRWHVTPKGDGPACYLHQFLRSDDDRALHDHPWQSVGIILRGRYVEHLDGGDSVLRLPGDVIYRPAEHLHRVELQMNDQHRPLPVWTLFLVGARERDWFFKCPQGFVPWQVFTAG